MRRSARGHRAEHLAARTLDIPGGMKMIQEYYRQMRKFGCNILAVVQQYDIIKDSPVRGAMIGNSKMLLKLKEVVRGVLYLIKSPGASRSKSYLDRISTPTGIV
jgi:hypothetical protein